MVQHIEPKIIYTFARQNAWVVKPAWHNIYSTKQTTIKFSKPFIMEQQPWYTTWFDSPYYHILYKNHDQQEAQLTLDRLLNAMQIKPGGRVLDLACGKGRHAIYLAGKGFDVTGIDISPASIAYARQFEQENLAFYQHDMRQPFRMHYYDAILNMFTSFGYFETDADHLKTLINVSKQLQSSGLFLLDFFNSVWVRSVMAPENQITVDEISFKINKRIEGGSILKTIQFFADGRDWHFQERVRLFELEDFERMFALAGLKIKQLYGTYLLDPFEVKTTPRLILVAEKP